MNGNRETLAPETRTHEGPESYDVSTPSERGVRGVRSVQWVGALGADDGNDLYDNVPCTD